MEARRLYRSSTHRVLAGVCGGLAEYLNIDPVLVRLAWLAAVLLGGFGILLYIIWIFVVPLKPALPSEPVARSSGTIPAIFGGALIILGIAFLMDNFEWINLDWWWHNSWEIIAPGFLILLGIYLIIRRRTVQPEKTEQRNMTTAEPTAQRPETDGPRRLHRSQSDKKLFGVCGGIAEYFDADPTLVRLLWVGLTLAAPPVGILGYFASAILFPVKEAKKTDPSTQAA